VYGKDRFDTIALVSLRKERSPPHSSATNAHHGSAENSPSLRREIRASVSSLRCPRSVPLSEGNGKIKAARAAVNIWNEVFVLAACSVCTFPKK